MGLPELVFKFEAAADSVVARTKQGNVALILRDTKANGIHVVEDESDLPAELGEANKAAIRRAMLGYINRPRAVYAAVLPADGDPADALALLMAYDYDYLAGPGDMTEAEGKALADAVIAKRKLRYIGKAVLPDQAADNEGIIDLSASGIMVGGAEFTGAEYCGRVAGMLAGTPIACSATYAELPELTDVDTDSEKNMNDAINAGKLIMLNDGRKCKLGRAVTSKVTIGDGESEILKKIKLVETVDLIRHFALTTAEDEYLGKCANTYDDKCVLLTAMQAYLRTLADEHVLERGTGNAEIDVAAQRAWLKENGGLTTGMTEQQIKQANTGSKVFVRMAGKVIDAMEDFAFSLAISQ